MQLGSQKRAWSSKRVQGKRACQARPRSSSVAAGEGSGTVDAWDSWTQTTCAPQLQSINVKVRKHLGSSCGPPEHEMLRSATAGRLWQASEARRRASQAEHEGVACPCTHPANRRRKEDYTHSKSSGHGTCLQQEHGGPKLATGALADEKKESA